MNMKYQTYQSFLIKYKIKKKLNTLSDKKFKNTSFQQPILLLLSGEWIRFKMKIGFSDSEISRRWWRHNKR